MRNDNEPKRFKPTDVDLTISYALRIYKKRLLVRCTHHFKSDLIYNIDHMRIPVNEINSNVTHQEFK